MFEDGVNDQHVREHCSAKVVEVYFFFITGKTSTGPFAR